MDKQEWKNNMKWHGLTPSATSFAMYNDLCPACQGEDKPCVYCGNGRTYTAYISLTERRKVLQFQAAINRCLELQGEIEAEEKRYKELEYRYDLLQKRVATIEHSVTKFADDCNAEIIRIGEALDKIASARRYKVPLAKIQAWLQFIKNSFKEEK